MKNALLLTVLVTLFSINSRATHNLGGEITYEWVSSSMYNVTMVLYTDCQGVPPMPSVNVNYSSVSCGINQPRTLMKISTEDVSQVCDTMDLFCNGGTLPGLYKTIYRGTITAMSQCNDWVLSYGVCCRGIPTNISSSSANFYIETTFDNTVHLNNKSPYFVANPRWIVPVNGANLINAGAYDADGDSLHFSLVTPKISASTLIAYAAGYSATQPFGGLSTTIDPQTGIISTLAQNVGQFLIDVNVDEFRNGQLIGSTRREFSINVIVNSNALPSISNSSLTVSGCTVDTVNIDIYSSDVSDSITTSILYPLAPGNLPFFSNTSAPLNENTDFLTDTNNLQWDLSGLQANKDHVVYVDVIDGNCPIKFVQSYAVLVSVSNCVWPGDANNDLIADVWDVLPIGVFNGNTGSTRPSATLNWDGQWAPNWGVNQGSGDDIKHVDCNGDATIDANDTTAILQNYNLTHTKSANSFGGPNDPELVVGIVPDTVGTMTPLAIPIELGTSITPADSVYGVAMSISYDETKIDSIAGVTVDYSNSWLGTEGVDMITLDTNFFKNGQIDIALVRTDGQMMTGFGELLTLNVITIDNLSGKGTSYGALIVDFVKVTIIDLNEDLRPFNQQLDSVIIKDITNSVSEVLSDDDVSVSPNPNNGNFNIAIKNAGNLTIEIYNAVGQMVDYKLTEQANNYQVSLNSTKKGMYFLRVLDENNQATITKKVLVQ